MKDLLSLVIPTFQRPSYLKRKLFHLKLQSCNFKILILDTSAGRFLNQNKKTIKFYSSKLDINYYVISPNHFNFPKKIYHALTLVKTKYSVLTFDDDYVNILTLQDCVSFLENNNEFIAANGIVLNHILAKKKNFRVPMLGKYDVHANKDNYKRCIEYFHSRRKRNQLFHVWRTAKLKKLFKPFNKSEWKKYTEILFNLSAINSGRIYFVNKIFEIRNVDYNKDKYQENSIPKFREHFYKDFFDKNFYITVKNFYKMMLEIFPNSSQYEKEKYFRDTFYLYLNMRLMYSNENQMKYLFEEKQNHIERIKKYISLMKLKSLQNLINNLDFYSLNHLITMLNYDPGLDYTHACLISKNSPNNKFYNTVVTSFKKIKCD